MLEAKLSGDRPSPGIIKFQDTLNIPAIQLVKKIILRRSIRIRKTISWLSLPTNGFLLCPDRMLRSKYFLYF